MRFIATKFGTSAMRKRIAQLRAKHDGNHAMGTAEYGCSAGIPTRDPDRPTFDQSPARGLCVPAEPRKRRADKRHVVGCCEEPAI